MGESNPGFHTGQRTLWWCVIGLKSTKPAVALSGLGVWSEQSRAPFAILFAGSFIREGQNSVPSHLAFILQKNAKVLATIKTTTAGENSIAPNSVLTG